MKKDLQKHIFLRCCYGYGVSGMAVLVIGAILPFIIEEAGLNFLAAGGMLSVMAIGNLLASVVFPLLVPVLGKKRTIFYIALLVPACLLILSFLPSLPIMYLIMLFYGLARGAITILNNSAVNDIYDAPAEKLNILHCSFATGAFLAPFLTAVLIKIGFGWKTILYLILVLTTVSAISYGTMDYSLLTESSQGKRLKKEQASKTACDSKKQNFFKSGSFYCIAFILFFYLGVENCISGWFVTYLQNTGVMDAAYATALVSFTWLVIMAGRLICAALSKRLAYSTIILIDAAFSAVCFFILITTKSLPVVTAALLGFGFFLSGIYPTCVANAGPLIQGSDMGMSLLTAISALGGIIAPQLVGAAADHIGIVGAIGILTVNVIVVILLALANFSNWHKRRAPQC